MKKLQIFAWMVAGLVVYLLSSGPVWCIVRHMSSPIDKMRVLYYPVTLLGGRAEDIFERYTLWWAPPLQ